MAELLFNIREINNLDVRIAAKIGDLKNIIFNVLNNMGFTDTVNTPSEVAGILNGVRISILHLERFSRWFWQVLIAVGDEFDVTQQTLNDIAWRMDNILSS